MSEQDYEKSVRGKRKGQGDPKHTEEAKERELF